MYDSGKIITGLVIFGGLVTFPIWYGVGLTGYAAPPDRELPEGATQCVEDKEYMIANHMDLLNRWRDAVVRDGLKTYTSETFGTEHEMSLTRTCMDCHENRETFCTRCHDFANVAPTCWDCHLETKGSR